MLSGSFVEESSYEGLYNLTSEFIYKNGGKIATDENRLRIFHFYKRGGKKYNEEYTFLASNKIEALNSLYDYCYKKDFEQFNKLIEEYPNGKIHDNIFGKTWEEYIKLGRNYNLKIYEDFLMNRGIILEYEATAINEREVL